MITRFGQNLPGSNRARRHSRCRLASAREWTSRCRQATSTQEVTVQATSPLVNTESPIIGKVINQTEVAKLPLAIRNWDDLLALVPGVQGDRYTEESGSTSAGRTGGVSVHGNRSLQNNFLLDGVDNNSISTNVQELSTQVSRPSVDAINEFRVVTSPFAAEYGRAPGAAISRHDEIGHQPLLAALPTTTTATTSSMLSILHRASAQTDPTSTSRRTTRTSTASTWVDRS